MIFFRMLNVSTVRQNRPAFFFFFFFFSSHLKPMSLSVAILPVVTITMNKDLTISLRFSPYEVSSRCKFSTLTTRQLMVEFLRTHVLMLSATEEITQIRT